MAAKDDESAWMLLLKQGDNSAIRILWERYFVRLLELARKKLGAGPKRVADEEDVAISAFNSFCCGAATGKFERLDDSDDLWQIMAMITTRKAIRQLQRERAAKRGGGDVRGESFFGAGRDSALNAGIQDAISGGPTPEFIAIVDEEFELLLERLPDVELQRIALARLEGYSNIEIAAQVGRHVRSVERKLQLIRKYWTKPEC